MILPEDVIPRRGTALLLALVAALLLFRLGAVPLVGPDEPRYARVAVEMHRSGDPVTPRLAGEPWLEKPALYYWLTAAFMSVLGETEVAARLPSVVAFLAWVLCVVFLGTRLYGSRAGLHAGFVLGTSLLAFVYGRAATMDMLLAATVTGAIGLLGLAALDRIGRWAVPAGYALAALAVLAKGPLGVLLPLIVLGTHLALSRDGRGAWRLLSLRGALIFLLLALPWHVYLMLSQGRAFFEVFLLDHNLKRFFSTIHQHPGPFYYYIPVLLGSLFPWSGLVLPALARLRPRADAGDRLLLIWVLVPLVFFSLAGSKLPGYILPCVAPIALIAGRWAATVTQDDPRLHRSGLRVAALVGLIAGGFALSAPFLLLRRGEAVWPLLLPACSWALLSMAAFAWRVLRAPAAALALVRVAAAGFLLLLTHVAPPVLAGLDSGRDLFALARGEQVFVWGARRSVWMSGYFYNDGRVRELVSLNDVLGEATRGPILVLCGPKHLARIESAPVTVTRLAAGARGATLIRLALPSSARPGSRASSPF